MGNCWPTSALIWRVEHSAVERPDLEQDDALAQSRVRDEPIEGGGVVGREPTIVSRERLEVGAHHTVHIERGDPRRTLKHAGFDLVPDPCARDDHPAEHDHQARHQILAGERPARQCRCPSQLEPTFPSRGPSQWRSHEGHSA